MLTINGVDLGAHGLLVEHFDLPGPGGEMTRVINVPGARGGIRTGGNIESGQLRVRGHWVAVGGDHAAASDALDEIVASLAGECVIRAEAYPDREWVGWLQQSSAARFLEPAWVMEGGEISLDFLLPDPSSRARTATEGLLTAGIAEPASSFPLGSSDTDVDLVITNGAAAAIDSVRIRTLDLAGATLLDWAWDGPLAPLAALQVLGGERAVEVGGIRSLTGIHSGAQFPVLARGLGRRLLVDVVGGPAAEISFRYLRRWR